LKINLAQKVLNTDQLDSHKVL